VTHLRKLTQRYPTLEGMEAATVDLSMVLVQQVCVSVIHSGRKCSIASDILVSEVVHTPPALAVLIQRRGVIQVARKGGEQVFLRSST
jgi:hypothetical protein